jgi:hypothetical protein
VEAVKGWWEGRWVIPDQEPRDQFVFLGGIERPKIALAVEAIGRWIGRSFWQIVSAAFAITGLWIAAKNLWYLNQQVGYMADTQSPLDEARLVVQSLSLSLPASVSAAALGVVSKTPYNALVVRESLIWRMEELGRTACETIERDDLVAGILLARASLEGTALMWELHELVRNRSTLGPETLHTRILALLVGQRQEKGEVQMPNIMNLIDRLDRRALGTRHRYEYLSEYAHPNWSGVSGAYSQLNKEEFTTDFGRTARKKKSMSIIASNMLAGSLSLFQYDYNSFANLMPVWLSELEPFSFDDA